MAGTATGTAGVTNIQHVLGGQGADLLTGDAAANRLVGNGGNDNLPGTQGCNTLIGGAGLDALLGGTGFDYYFAELARHTLPGGVVTRVRNGPSNSVRGRANRLRAPRT